MTKPEITYGTRVKDAATGFVGTVAGFATYYGHGNDAYLVIGERTDQRTKGYPDDRWVSVNRIEVLDD